MPFFLGEISLYVTHVTHTVTHTAGCANMYLLLISHRVTYHVCTTCKYLNSFKYSILYIICIICIICIYIYIYNYSYAYYSCPIMSRFSSSELLEIFAELLLLWVSGLIAHGEAGGRGRELISPQLELKNATSDGDSRRPDRPGGGSIVWNR